MLLFVGLGNPGADYARNRHNIGFMAVDEIVRRHNFSAARKRFRGLTHEGRIGDEKILILKPQTYMNISGESVAEATRFFKIEPQQVVVFYDEIDLAPGKIKVKTGGGHAGHNGIRSISQHLGADFTRVRLGIGHPGDKARVSGHVLGDFKPADRDWVEPMLDAVARESAWLASGDAARFLNEVALRLAPPKPKREKPQPAGGAAAGPAPDTNTTLKTTGGSIADKLKAAFGLNKDTD